MDPIFAASNHLLMKEIAVKDPGLSNKAERKMVGLAEGTLVEYASSVLHDMPTVVPKSIDLKIHHFSLLDKGKVKFVWMPKEGSAVKRRFPASVFYTATPSPLFKNHEKELFLETKTMEKMTESILDEGGNIDHLATDIKKADFTLSQQPAYEVPVAKGSLEKFLTKELSFDQRLKFCKDILDGLKNLHLVGLAHGDMKADNFLVYEDAEGKLTLKLSDFGKTAPSDPNKIYIGNPRHASPEGDLTTDNDVFAAALVIIRVLEESLLEAERDILIPVPTGKFQEVATAGMRGAEKYVIEHNDFLACNKQAKISLLKARVKMGRLSPATKNAQVAAVHAYIDALEEGLKTKTSVANAENIGRMLKQMTVPAASGRITAAQALEWMELIA